MNDSTPVDQQEPLDAALEMSSLGYKIIPIPPGEKYPKGYGRWQERATADAETVAAWWGQTPNHGVGWAMGRQPNGQNLVAIDIDEALDGSKSGLAWFQDWGDQHCTDDEWHVIASTVASETGGGGSHLIFSVPDDFETSNGIFGQDVDVRGEGGFIVIPPTIHPNGNPYLWVNKPGDHDILPAPDPVLEALRPPESPQKAPPPLDAPKGLRTAEIAAQGPLRGDSPADWARANFSINSMLLEAGWTQDGVKGGDVFWVRPGKSPRDGHSAVVHDDEVMVVWSTSAPIEFWRIGSTNADGSKSLSAFDVFAAIAHTGDRTRAATHIRRNLMPRPSRPAAAVVVDVGGDGDAQEEGDGPDQDQGVPHSLNLPDEFWEARPWLTHIRDAAWSRLISPDALLVSVMARFAATVPPTLKIPAMVGHPATFDFIGCVVASSSGGKSVSNGVAAELLPDRRLDVRFDVRPGSGEGLIAAFMGWEKDEKGKRVGSPSYKFGDHIGIHFTVDEGTALLEQAGRNGATIVQTLCTAWSGAGMGQENANMETKREVPAGKRRVSVTLNIQTGAAKALMEPETIGLPQRILFSWAHAPSVRDHISASFPGPLTFPTIPLVGETTLLYHHDIVSEVRALRLDVVEGITVLDNLDGHLMLQKLKVAGLLTLMDGLDEVTPDEWDLAEQIIQTHLAVRARIVAVAATQQGEKSYHRAVAAGQAEAIKETVREQHLVEAMRDRIIERVEAAGPEGVARSTLRESMSAKPTRVRFDHAWALAEQGGIRKSGKRWVKA